MCTSAVSSPPQTQTQHFLLITWKRPIICCELQNRDYYVWHLCGYCEVSTNAKANCCNFPKCQKELLKHLDKRVRWPRKFLLVFCDQTRVTSCSEAGWKCLIRGWVTHRLPFIEYIHTPTHELTAYELPGEDVIFCVLITLSWFAGLGHARMLVVVRLFLRWWFVLGRH